MDHKIKSLLALPEYKLNVSFRCGESRQYDFNDLIESLPIYKHFFVEEGIFDSAYVSDDGFQVEWNEYVKIGCEELWMNGKKIKTAFDSLLSCADAAEIWGMDESTLRKAILSGRFKDGMDVLKFGKQWVITKKAMVREYGDPESNFDDLFGGVD